MILSHTESQQELEDNLKNFDLVYNLNIASWKRVRINKKSTGTI